jgi:hypothetical protein
LNALDERIKDDDGLAYIFWRLGSILDEDIAFLLFPAAYCCSLSQISFFVNEIRLVLIPEQK